MKFQEFRITNCSVTDRWIRKVNKNGFFKGIWSKMANRRLLTDDRRGHLLNSSFLGVEASFCLATELAFGAGIRQFSRCLLQIYSGWKLETFQRFPFRISNQFPRRQNIVEFVRQWNSSRLRQAVQLFGIGLCVGKGADLVESVYVGTESAKNYRCRDGWKSGEGIARLDQRLH